MTLDEIRAFAPSMGSLLWVAFSGGEVFLREDIVEIVKIFYACNRPSIILLPTNGLMPARILEKSEEVLRNCPRSIVTVKLSLDGIGEKHDSLRGIKGSFNKVMETYEALGGLLYTYKNFELGINTVFCKDNQGRMDEIIEFVKGLRMIKTHTISLVRGDLNNDTSKDVDIDKYLEAIRKLEKNLKDGSSPTYSFSGAKIKAAQDIIQRRLIHRTAREKRQLLPCYAGRINLVLTEEGDVYPCELFNKEYLLGNVRESCYSMKDILKSARARNIITTVKNRCFCTHECYMMTNILFNPRMYPGIIKEAVQIR